MSKLKTSEIDDVLSRGVAEFIDPDNSFRKKLEAKAAGQYGKDIVVKFGVDPTKPDLHLGHAVVLRGLRRLQDLGCKVVFLIGDFTARIGDPSGKSKVRPEVDFRELEENVKTYLEQVRKILIVDDKKVFSWIRNSDWSYTVSDIEPKGEKVSINFPGKESIEVPARSFLGKAAVFENTRMQKTVLNSPVTHDITLNNFLSTLRRLTHSRLISRDMFQERLKNNEELYMHEMMYPVLQGLDSLLISKIYGSCDLEVGGNDQTFNMLMGRDVMKVNGAEPQAVLAYKIIRGTDGTEKMSKSLDNYIGITESPAEMFGKIMSVPDSLIGEYFELATYAPADEVSKIVSEISKGKINPRDAKERLASEIVAIYHGEEAAKEAVRKFNETFKEGKISEDAEEIGAKSGDLLKEILVSSKTVASKSEFTRLIKAGAICEVGGEKITDADAKISKNLDLRVGKHRFVKIRLSA